MSGKLKEQWRGFFEIIAVVVFLLAVIAGSAAPVWARDLPASTFLPFYNKQSVYFDGSDNKRGIYPMEDGYIFISYKQDITSGEHDIKAQKLDKEGKELWNKVYNLKGQDTLLVMHLLKNGFVMAVNSQEAERNVIRVLQIGSNGEIVWQRELPLKTVNSIASTNDHGLVIAGSTGENKEDIRIIKMDKSGDWKDEKKNPAQWDKTYAEAGKQQANQIIQVLDKDEYNDGYILTGYTDSNSNGKRDLYLLRLDAYGEVKWSKNYGGKYDDEGITVAAGINTDEDIVGFLVAGNTEDYRGDKNIYLIYVNKYGSLQSWPGYQRAVDGEKERRFGDTSEQMSMALLPVPDGFRESRKFRGKAVAGQGGVVLAGYSPDSREVLVIRINEYGKVLWQENLPVPGDNLILSTLVKGGDSKKQEIAYSTKYPAKPGEDMEVHALEIYLEGVLEQDKSKPQEEQQETNRENIRWRKSILKYAAMRDISKEIKDLLNQQAYLHLTAGSGRGEIKWPDSSYYLGDLLIGKADGEGTLLFSNGVWYKGTWKNNMFNGKGCLRFPTGEYYEGEFKEHAMQGKGTMKWPGGEKYEGDYLNNQRDGQGKFTWPNRTYYEGGFSEDKASGIGIIRWPNGEYYDGQMDKGNANGQGTYYFPSGEWYRGEIKNLSFEGVGIYHWPDGSYYVGEFKQDRLNGEGYYVWPNGVQQWGYWKNDHYLGTNPESGKTREKW